MAPIIAIDFGTSLCRVGVFRNGKFEVIPNEKGNLETPCWVAFTDSGILVGEAAKSQPPENAERTICGPKICIGQPFDNKDVINRWEAYSGVNIAVHNGQVSFQVKGQSKTFTPEEIIAMILLKMRQAAEAYLGSKVTDAVVTVPACFLDSQRQALFDAGTIAGLNIRRLINEPSAAILSFLLENNIPDDQDVMLFGAGDSACDVTIACISEGVVEVLSTDGSSYLGGVDFTTKIASFLRMEFKRLHNFDPAKSPAALRRLITAAEEAKIILSNQTSALIDIPSVMEGLGLKVNLTRAQLENVCSDLIDRCRVHIERGVEGARLQKSSLRKVLLTGGTCNIPAVKACVERSCGHAAEDMITLPDKAALHGAAILASIQSGDRSGNLSDLLFLDVSSKSVGTETLGGVSTILIPHFTTIPTKKEETFSTASDNQSAITIQILEGEREMAKDNAKVAQIAVNVPPAPRGVPQVKITFNINESGIIEPSCTDHKLECNKGRLSKEEKDTLAAEVQRSI